MPSAVRTQVVEIVRGSAGAAIPSLAADPRTAPVAQAAREAMIDASRTTAWFAAAALLMGLLATLAIPNIPAPEAAERHT